jgi:hypothetical protein
MQHILKEKCPSLHSLNPKQSKWVSDIVGKRNHVSILGSKTMLIWGVLIFFAQKIIFHFFASEMGFLKHLPKIYCKNGPPQFHTKILYHILWTIHQLFAWKKFCRHP